MTHREELTDIAARLRSIQRELWEEYTATKNLWTADASSYTYSAHRIIQRAISALPKGESK